jgi:hypothetical protein
MRREALSEKAKEMAHFVVVAGEPSGDVLGAKLISDLKENKPKSSIFRNCWTTYDR